MERILTPAADAAEELEVHHSPTASATRATRSPSRHRDAAR
jgi:hypothetical protein